MQQRQPPGRPQRGRALGAVHSMTNTSLVHKHGWPGSSEQQAMVLDDDLEMGGTLLPPHFSVGSSHIYWAPSTK